MWWAIAFVATLGWTVVHFDSDAEVVAFLNCVPSGVADQAKVVSWGGSGTGRRLRVFYVESSRQQYGKRCEAAARGAR